MRNRLYIVLVCIKYARKAFSDVNMFYLSIALIPACYCNAYYYLIVFISASWLSIGVYGAFNGCCRLYLYCKVAFHFSVLNNKYSVYALDYVSLSLPNVHHRTKIFKSAYILIPSFPLPLRVSSAYLLSKCDLAKKAGASQRCTV